MLNSTTQVSFSIIWFFFDLLSAFIRCIFASARLIADAIHPTASLGVGHFIGAVAGAAFPYRGSGSLVAQAILLDLPNASPIGITK